MQSTHNERVREMMRGFGQDCPEKPTVADVATRSLRFRLLLEEVLEFGEAAGIAVFVRDDFVHCLKELKEPVPLSMGKLVFSSFSEPNLVDLADAVADISVVNEGAAIAFGLPMSELQETADSNNLLKIQTGSKCPETGKFLKSPNHPKPDFAKVLRDHGWEG